MKRMLPLFVAGWVALACAWASAAPAKPIGPIEPANCVTAECHAGVKDHKMVHGPVNVGACDACHTPVDPAQHTFKLAREGGELCTFCHQIQTQGMKVVHKPVAEGQCLGCHDPHGANNAAFTRGDTEQQLCQRCHDSVTRDKKFVHGPVASGECQSCHAAHASNHANLLSDEGRDMCLNCHADMKKQLADARFVHKPAQAACTDCHTAHASNEKMQLKQPPVELCGSCHEKEIAAAKNAKFKHSVVLADQACENCHTAHGSNLANLMKAQPIVVCMKCHDKPVKGADGVVIAAVADVSDPNLVKHGPIRDGNCGGCHNTHGSEYDRLLTAPYPKTFYQPFKVEDYALCFSCHDKQLVTIQQAKGLTGFRNGDENLHYLHVNKADRGRSCRACHNAHASPNAMHVRDTVPYGQWQMPIKFTKTDGGGSCSPGCHKPYAYDRDKAVSYAAPKAGK